MQSLRVRRLCQIEVLKEIAHLHKLIHVIVGMSSDLADKCIQVKSIFEDQIEYNRSTNSGV